MSVSAQQILELLEKRHAKDVFVAECKDGPTQYTSHNRLDGWAMKRSWAHPLAIGYEIKVSRADFLKDTKWHAYLDYCNEFYFVAPDGVLKVGELGKSVGWLRVSSGGKRLFVKKRAAYREVEIPESFYRYVLMARAVIANSQRDMERAIGLRDAEYWREWLERRDDLRHIGYRVSRRLKERIEREIVDVRNRNKNLQYRAESLESVRSILRSLGLSQHSFDLDRRLKDAATGVMPQFESAVRTIEQSVSAIRKAMAVVESEGQDDVRE